MIRIFFLSQSSPILELFPFDEITLKSYICTVVTVMAKQCWSQTVLESGSWGHSVLQTPALVLPYILNTICWINVTPGILVPCDPMNDHLLYLGHCDLYFMLQ